MLREGRTSGSQTGNAIPDINGNTGISAIELEGVSKTFGNVVANHKVSLSIPQGTIYGIIGENGAGKSTLMSILYGFYRADAGQIRVAGEVRNITDPQAAIACGIGMVFQHFKLVENFTVLENIVLGAEDGALLGDSLKKSRATLAQLASDYGLEIDPDAITGTLGVGLQQRVEIIKALYRKASILILDEPTGVLTPSEADQLFRILARLRQEGKTIIFITHKLREIMAITDFVAVMRKGALVGTVPTRATNPEKLAEMMVGRKVLLRLSKKPAAPSVNMLRIHNLHCQDSRGAERLKGINLTVAAGEILGIAGVAGNGQSELLEVLGGYREASGSVEVDGKAIALRGSAANGRTRRAAGIAHVPEDRQSQGLIMDFCAWENAALGNQDNPAWNRGIILDHQAMHDSCAARMQRFDVRPLQPRLAARNFSGGNQQKLVLAREIECNPRLLLVGQPTRGVDIGAIEFIHQRLIALRDTGAAILLVSVELEEILSLSDRIAVMFDGRIMGERRPGETNERELGLLMAGMTKPNA